MKTETRYLIHPEQLRKSCLEKVPLSSNMQGGEVSQKKGRRGPPNTGECINKAKL